MIKLSKTHEVLGAFNLFFGIGSDNKVHYIRPLSSYEKMFPEKIVHTPQGKFLSPCSGEYTQKQITNKIYKHEIVLVGNNGVIIFPPKNAKKLYHLFRGNNGGLVHYPDKSGLAKTINLPPHINREQVFDKKYKSEWGFIDEILADPTKNVWDEADKIFGRKK